MCFSLFFLGGGFCCYCCCCHLFLGARPALFCPTALSVLFKRSLQTCPQKIPLRNNPPSHPPHPSPFPSPLLDRPSPLLSHLITLIPPLPPQCTNPLTNPHPPTTRSTQIQAQRRDEGRAGQKLKRQIEGEGWERWREGRRGEGEGERGGKGEDRLAG